MPPRLHFMIVITGILGVFSSRVMKKFGYLRDPLCLASLLSYVVNRWLLIPMVSSPFLHGTFNDLLLIPAALPPVLWIQRQMGWRTHNRPPTPSEIFGHWAIWSLVCEGLAPWIFPRAVADFQDVLAYAVGALIAGLWWNRGQLRRFFRTSASGFDRLARFYDVMENLLAGRKLIRCREFFLSSLPVPPRVLLVGEGHGRFLAAFLERYPHSEITCVDASARMLAVTRRRLRGRTLTAPVHFLRRDLRSWSPPEKSYHLVVTNFLLDCFTPTELPQVMTSLAASVTPGGHWLLSDFQLPAAKGWRRLRAAVILWIMYRFFRLVTRLPASELTPPGPHFTQLGFQRQDRQEFEWGLIVSEVWQGPDDKNSSSLET